jgi:hypothetical protein
MYYDEKYSQLKLVNIYNNSENVLVNSDISNTSLTYRSNVLYQDF